MSQKICIVEYYYVSTPTLILYDAYGQRIGECEIPIELYNQLDR